MQRLSPASLRPGLRDILVVAAALALLAGVTAVVALRAQWTRLLGASIIPVPIATLTTSDFHCLAFDSHEAGADFDRRCAGTSVPER